MVTNKKTTRSEDHSEATVVEPVAAMPLGTYPEYNEDGTIKEPETDADDAKAEHHQDKGKS